MTERVRLGDEKYGNDDRFSFLWCGEERLGTVERLPSGFYLPVTARTPRETLHDCARYFLEGRVKRWERDLRKWREMLNRLNGGFIE